jgi:hypothetical protein
MNRYEVDRYVLLSSKKHEAKIQELRHERKTEFQRLDCLKKLLQTKLQRDPTESREVQAA